MDTMELRAACQPLPMKVTAAGRESLTLRALVRQAIPILRNPEGSSEAKRQELADTLLLAVGGESDTSEKEDCRCAAASSPWHPFPGDEDAPLEEIGYEPGCRIEEETE